MVLISSLIIVTYFAMRREKLSSFKVWSIPIVLFIGILVMKAFNSHAYGLKFKDIAVVMDFTFIRDFIMDWWFIVYYSSVT